jgi:hypothetical protein
MASAGLRPDSPATERSRYRKGIEVTQIRFRRAVGLPIVDGAKGIGRSQGDSRALTSSMPSQRAADAHRSWSRPNRSPAVALSRHCPPRLAPSLAPAMSYATIPSDEVTATTHASSTCAFVLLRGPAGRGRGLEGIRRGRQPLCRMRVPHRHEQARREPRPVRRCGRCGSGRHRWCRGRQAAQSGPAPPGQQGSRCRVR